MSEIRQSVRTVAAPKTFDRMTIRPHIGSQPTTSYWEYSSSPYRQCRVFVPDDRRETIFDLGASTNSESMSVWDDDAIIARITRDRNVPVNSGAINDEGVFENLLLPQIAIGSPFIFAAKGIEFFPAHGSVTTFAVCPGYAKFVVGGAPVDIITSYPNSSYSNTPMSNELWTTGLAQQIGLGVTEAHDSVQETGLAKPYFRFLRGAKTNDDAEELFASLAAKWKSERVSTSSNLDIFLHDAYQKIIGLGRSAVPMILRELEKSQDHWYWALAAITREDPVPATLKGNMPAMRQSWLNWGRREGYEW
jgi:hypothetical protein